MLAPVCPSIRQSTLLSVWFLYVMFSLILICLSISVRSPSIATNLVFCYISACALFVVCILGIV